jgi:hypothetical protein
VNEFNNVPSRLVKCLANATRTGSGEDFQKDLLEARDLNELKAIFKKWRRIGWKNVCKLWLQERTPEQLKGEGD